MQIRRFEFGVSRKKILGRCAEPALSEVEGVEMTERGMGMGRERNLEFGPSPAPRRLGAAACL